MERRLDHGELRSVLEDSKLRCLPLLVTLDNGDEFEDQVTDLGTFEGEEHVAFAQHDFTPVRGISRIRRSRTVQ